MPTIGLRFIHEKHLEIQNTSEQIKYEQAIIAFDCRGIFKEIICADMKAIEIDMDSICHRAKIYVSSDDKHTEYQKRVNQASVD